MLTGGHVFVINYCFDTRCLSYNYPFISHCTNAMLTLVTFDNYRPYPLCLDCVHSTHSCERDPCIMNIILYIWYLVFVFGRSSTVYGTYMAQYIVQHMVPYMVQYTCTCIVQYMIQ